MKTRMKAHGEEILLLLKDGNTIIGWIASNLFNNPEIVCGLLKEEMMTSNQDQYITVG